jgi:hypothetical protein
LEIGEKDSVSTAVSLFFQVKKPSTIFFVTIF